MNDQRWVEHLAYTTTAAQARACHGKVKFPSKKNAEGRARAIDHALNAYKCPLCRRWHIGNPRPWSE